MVSHHLHEVLATADTVPVLRDGCLVSSAPVGEERRGEPDPEDGRAAVAPHVRRQAPPSGRGRGRARSLRRSGGARSCAASASPCAPARSSGSPGSSARGAPSSPAASSAPIDADRGAVRVAGHSGQRLRSPRAASDAGVVMVPEDRKAQGLVLDRSIAENLALSSREGRLPFRLRPAELARGRDAQEWVTRSDIRPPASRKDRPPALRWQPAEGAAVQVARLPTEGAHRRRADPRGRRRARRWRSTG